MAEDSGEGVDLFGEPLSPWKDPRGRKRHKRSMQVAETVAVLRATGQSAERIAALVGLSEPTLRKYYFRELDQGASLAQGVLDAAMWAKAKTGVAAAARYMRERFEAGEVAVPVARQRRSEIEDKPEKTEKLGKKAAAEAEAHIAHEGTEWGTLLKH
jgi:predicted transcriptional regulator